MKLARHILAAGLVALAPLAVSAIQNDPAATQQTKLPEGPLKIRVVAVTGDVGVIAPGKDDIQDAKADMVLAEGVEVIVGQRSTIQLDVGTGQMITFRRMTSAVITRAAIESGSINIDVGMKYGQTAFEGESQDRALRTNIKSPGATLAIRGTEVALTDQPPFAPEVVSLSGRVEYTDIRKRIALGRKNGGKVKVDQKNDTAAETALASSYVDPTISGARTASEQQLVANVISTGANVVFDSGFPIVSGGTPPSIQNIAASIPDGLVYIFRWDGNINFNFTASIIDTNETIYPAAGLNRSTSGYIPFDHRGGPNGGYELAVFPPGYPGSDCVKNPDGTFSGTSTLFRRADFTPNGNPSGFELQAYVDHQLSLDVLGMVNANGTVSNLPSPIPRFITRCEAASILALNLPAPASQAKATAAALADCGCDALIPPTPSVKAKPKVKMAKAATLA